MSAKTRTQTLHIACYYGTRHKPNFGGKSEAGKSVAIVSARQHRPEGQNPIALIASRRNAAQAWLRSERDPKKWVPVFRKDHAPTKK
jgi:hypothetical protein